MSRCASTPSRTAVGPMREIRCELTELPVDGCACPLHRDVPELVTVTVPKRFVYGGRP